MRDRPFHQLFRQTTASVEAVLANPRSGMPIRHSLSFTNPGGRFELVEERIEDEKPGAGADLPHFYYRFQKRTPLS